MIINKKDSVIALFIFSIVFLFAFNFSFENVSAEETDPSVCCAQTTSGNYCQNVPVSECAEGSDNAPTSCETTSFCRAGYCFDSSEGTCTDNTPQLVCNQEGGVWSREEPPQCGLGCCVLGDQAAFVTQTRCKKLSSDLGLQTNYRTDIDNEFQCVMSVAGQQKGACVYEEDFERTCQYTSRAACDEGLGSSGERGEFFEGKLCSAEELGTNCGPTRNTMRVDGKDEVYFADSCGNPANIYDASKVNDLGYWGNVRTKTESCNPNSANANSATCGNCNYLLGSVARRSDDNTGSARYGDFICADLNCEDTSTGRSYRHGESWCVESDAGQTGVGEAAVGSRFYRHLCINGEEVVEPCADFRQEECIQGAIETDLGTFSQAACRVNRWQDCGAQDNQLECENTDRRDCIWRADISGGTCIPQNPPGLKFWEGDEVKNICAQADRECTVTYSKGLFDSSWTCENNCHCLEEGWLEESKEFCRSLGDCGPGVNWLGEEGYAEAYTTNSPAD